MRGRRAKPWSELRPGFEKGVEAEGPSHRGGHEEIIFTKCIAVKIITKSSYHYVSTVTAE